MFFNKHPSNSIEFWDCLSDEEWPLYVSVDKDMKKLNLTPLFPYKTSWNFNKKKENDDIIKQWCMTFQVLDLKGKHFLNDDLTNIKYTKGGLWINHFGHSNSLCARTTQAITNHAPIGEYQLRFFPREEFSCPCGSYPIESRCHILHECRRFSKYWNPMRDTISQFVSFLEFNLNAFSFGESIT